MKAIVSLAVTGMLTALFAVQAPSVPPAPMICVPCEVVEWYDGDTGTVRITLDVRVRLLDCWADEVKTRDLEAKKRGLLARDHLRKKFPAGSRGILEVPISGDERLDDAFTMGRLLGRVWIDGTDVSQEQVATGHATRTKGAE